MQYQNVAAVNTETHRGSQRDLSKINILEGFPDVFHGTGKLEGQYKLEIGERVRPVVHPTRRVPFVLKGKLKQELDRLQSSVFRASSSSRSPMVKSVYALTQGTSTES